MNTKRTVRATAMPNDLLKLQTETLNRISEETGIDASSLMLLNEGEFELSNNNRALIHICKKMPFLYQSDREYGNSHYQTMSKFEAILKHKSHHTHLSGSRVLGS